MLIAKLRVKLHSHRGKRNVTQPVLSGLVAALITPMTDDGSAVRLESVGALVDALIRAGVDGFFACGSTGETPVLSDEERLAVSREAIHAAAGRVPVVVQATVNTTERTIHLARSLAAIGVQGIALLSPGYYRFRDDELTVFFTAVANSVPELPVYLYNIPQRTGNPITPSMAEMIARRASNVVGIKDSSGSMQQLLGLLAVRERLEQEGRRFSVLSGDDGLALPALCGGANGLVSGNASVVPEPFVELLHAVRAGDVNHARRLSAFINEVASVLQNGSRLDLFKAIATKRGIPAGAVRPPALPGSEAEAMTVWSQLEAIYGRKGKRLGPL